MAQIPDSSKSQKAENPERSPSTVHRGSLAARLGSIDVGAATPPPGRSQSIKPLDFTIDVPMDIPYPPFVDIRGVPNFRDVGGYSCLPPPKGTSDSSQKYSVRQGFAYRCSELSQITPEANVEMVEKRNIHKVFDLRSELEFANPRGKPQGAECISTPVFRKQDVTYVMSLQQIKWSTAPDYPKKAGFSQGYVDWYRQILVYGARSAYRIIFEHIRDHPDEPFVYHCSAGKDRTGVLSAVILRLCGVDSKTVAWEYSLTVPGMGVWENAVEQEMVGDSMTPVRSHGGMTREEAQRVCGSRASNMEQFLKAVLEKEFGGAAKYMVKLCKFTDEDVEKIRMNLLSPVAGTVHPVELPTYTAHTQT